MTTPNALPPSRIIIAGGSGFLGTAIARYLSAHGHEVRLLTRTPRPRQDLIREIAWNGRDVGAWAKELDGAAAVINLTGRNINTRHTEQHRREIVSSRVGSVRAIGAAIAECYSAPRVWVQASAVGIYGNAGDRICDESAPHGRDFMAQACEQWEAAFRDAVAPNTRKVVLRFGVALGRDGGALPMLARLARAGLGGTVGSGRQYLSWIHIDDLVAVVERAVLSDTMVGPYNASNHVPETNATFMKRLRHAVHRPWSPPAPAFAVKLGAYVIGTDPAVALEGQRCVPKRLDEEGFVFKHEDLGEALNGLLG